MFSPFERMVASRYLRPRKEEGFVSVIAIFSLLGIALGVATLIIVMAVMNGFRQELLSRILGINGHLTVYGPPVTGLVDYQGLTGLIEGLPSVVTVDPLVEGQVMVTANGIARGALVRGFSIDNLKRKTILADNIVAGSLDRLAGDASVMIGSRLAERMGVSVGDAITLISPQGNVTAFGTIPRVRAYTIAALYEIGMFEYDSGFVFMPLDAAQTFFQLPGAVTALEVFVQDPNRAPDLVRDVYGVAGANVRVHDWQRANASFFTAIQVERNVMFLILTLIILVAAFNIVSSLIMLVKDKGRDIAILRTMGATRGMIMRVFFLAGASIGVIGTLAGLVLGVAFAANIETIRQWIQSLTGTELFSAEIYFLSRLPAEIDPIEVVTVVAMALGLSFLATLYPAWQAARVEPAEALRYE